MVDLQLILGVLIHENQLFLPNAVLRIAFTINAPGLDYGKMTFLKFARKCQPSVTGNPAPFFPHTAA